MTIKELEELKSELVDAVLAGAECWKQIHLYKNKDDEDARIFTLKMKVELREMENKFARALISKAAKSEKMLHFAEAAMEVWDSAVRRAYGAEAKRKEEVVRIYIDRKMERGF